MNQDNPGNGSPTQVGTSDQFGLGKKPLVEVLRIEWRRVETEVSRTKNTRSGRYREDLVMVLSCGHVLRVADHHGPAVSRVRCWECGVAPNDQVKGPARQGRSL